MRNSEIGRFNMDPNGSELQPEQAEWQGPLTYLGDIIYMDGLSRYGREEANIKARDIETGRFDFEPPSAHWHGPRFKSEKTAFEEAYLVNDNPNRGSMLNYANAIPDGDMMYGTTYPDEAITPRPTPEEAQGSMLRAQGYLERNPEIVEVFKKYDPYTAPLRRLDQEASENS